MRKSRKDSEDFGESEFATLLKAGMKKTDGFEKMRFAASFAPPTDVTLYQFTVRRLCITNGKLNPDTNLLEDSDQTTSLPPITLSPIVLTKDVRNNPAYPRGVKIVLAGGEGGVGWDVVAGINGMMGELPSYGKARKMRGGVGMMVYCPVKIAEGEDVWFLCSSKDPQGYWSKRGLSISLDRP